MKTAYIGGYVISGRQDASAVRADVLVENGKIAAVGEIDKSGAKTVDCTGKYIMPGLINLHAHLFGTGRPSKALGGGAMQKILVGLVHTPVGAVVADMLVSSALKAELHSGVTTLRSSGDFVGSDIRAREKLKKGKIEGPRLICPGAAITVPTGHGAGTFADTAVDPKDFEKLVDKRKKAGADYIKICVTGGVMDAKEKGSPGEVKMNLEQTKAVCDRAHKYGMKVASHTQSPDGLRVAIMGGVDTIEHGADFDGECQAVLRERGGAVVPTFTPAYPMSVLPPEITKLSDICVYNSSIVTEGMKAGIRTAKKAGIKVGLGTDASCPFSAQYGMWREIFYYHKFMGGTAAEAIYRGTLAGAEILGIENETGSVEKGKIADMMILDRNPLDDLTAMKNPVLVVHEGREIKPGIKRNEQTEALLDGLCAKL